MNPAILLTVAILAMLVPSQGWAQDSPIHIYVGAPGRNKVPLALPRPVGGHAKMQEFHTVVQRDLELCGWFDDIDRQALSIIHLSEHTRLRRITYVVFSLKKKKEAILVTTA